MCVTAPAFFFSILVRHVFFIICRKYEFLFCQHKTPRMMKKRGGSINYTDETNWVFLPFFLRFFSSCYTGENVWLIFGVNSFLMRGLVVVALFSALLNERTCVVRIPQRIAIIIISSLSFFLSFFRTVKNVDLKKVRVWIDRSMMR